MDTENIKDKAKFFFDRKIIIHITTHKDSWYNGLILEISNNHLILNDKVHGESFILFEEIKTIDKYKEKEESRNGTFC
jgi:hypothetical protein|tara:strand:+ start:5434 stop:5667 length:234 start_codon:yes stop_codon:yes gene_type:complete